MVIATSHQELFRLATGFEPYPYQSEMAASVSMASLVSVPTGLGKTAAVVLAWLWRRRFAAPEVRRKTPRRLVYCLPMRVLVEQTRDAVIGWLSALQVLTRAADDNGVAVHTLLGGDVDNDWDVHPEQDAVLVGTQDMLLSRALNRGYALSRFRWPVQFGLLNNDCLWVMDEVQLMGSGLASTAQLQALRRVCGTILPTQSMWMSATINPQWLATVDFRSKEDAPSELMLTADDLATDYLAKRMHAKKVIHKAEKPANSDKSAKQDAVLVNSSHRAGTRTLVIVNTVKRAVGLHKAIKKGTPAAKTVLLHSHFRPRDRQEALRKLLDQPGPEGTIAVSTQVVEAGVDVSATTLFTDLAPWPSLVQRFGRCNRGGESDNADIVWFDLDHTKASTAAPYAAEELEHARWKLGELRDAAPVHLPTTDKDESPTHVLRQSDLLELFDTTPDLAGADIDVSRFIRDADEHNVHLFWRHLGKSAPPPDAPQAARDELCSVPIGEAREFARKHTMWLWDHLEGQWERVGQVAPGQILMVPADSGGYLPEQGWSLRSRQPVTPVSPHADSPESYDADPIATQAAQSVVDHVEQVVSRTEGLLDVLEVGERNLREPLLTAARYHDVGKAHTVFQEALVGVREGELWAKAPNMTRYARPGFRHELASAIAMLQHGHPDLAAYLAAAHHGKVRLSIRSLPHERPPADPNALFARGVWDGDSLPEVSVGAGATLPETVLDLSYMALGEGPRGPSWLARMLRLRDDPQLGPFRLALMETLLRVADWRASSQQTGGTP
jgi:CRISPR-associated endonuclease/helicase Cas3